MDLTLNCDKTCVTRVIDGFDFIGFHFVKRKSPRKEEHHLHFPSQVCSEDSEPPEVPHVATYPITPKEFRGDGESDHDGMGELFPTYERQPGFSASAFREHPFSPVPDLT